MLVLLGPHVRRLGVARQPENAVSSVLRSSLVCTLGINSELLLTRTFHPGTSGFAHSCSEVCNGRLNRLARLASGNLLGGCRKRCARPDVVGSPTISGKRVADCKRAGRPHKDAAEQRVTP